MSSGKANVAANWQPHQSYVAEVDRAQARAAFEASAQSAFARLPSALAIVPGGTSSRQKAITRTEFANIPWRKHVRSENIVREGWLDLARLRRGETV
jgi:hypothetical protein